jgi:hypothetical protein
MFSMFQVHPAFAGGCVLVLASNKSVSLRGVSFINCSAVYGGGGVTEDPEPDTDAIVARIPRGPQIRVEKPRSYK